MRKRKVMIMSLKDSMIRGLALSGMDAIARAGYADSKMFADIINAANKDRSLNLANNPVHEIARHIRRQSPAGRNRPAHHNN